MKRILLLRPQAQVPQSIVAIEAIGAVPIVASLLSLKKVEANVPQQPFNRLILSSATAIHFLKQQENWTLLLHVPVVAVGQKTADKAIENGFKVTHVAPNFRVKSLVESLTIAPFEQILNVRGQTASMDIATALKEKGALATDLVVYQQEKMDWTPQIHREIAKGVDVVLLTSFLMVSYFVAELAQENESAKILKKAKILTIGEETKKYAESHGLQVDAYPSIPSFEAMLSLVEFF